MNLIFGTVILRKVCCSGNVMLLTGALAGCSFMTGSFAYSSEQAGVAEGIGMQSPVLIVPAASQLASADHLPDSGMLNTSQSLYYRRNWGVEVIGMHPVASGYMLDFRYRVVDPVKARQLSYMKNKAYVIDEVSGKRLAIPALESAGELRSGDEPEEGRTYFIIFGNPGQLVKSGGRVSVVIGKFRIDGLLVD